VKILLVISSPNCSSALESRCCFKLVAEAGECSREVKILLVISSPNCSSALESRCCYKLVAEARGYFGNPEEGERPPLAVVTRQRLLKI
jgi:hypothetical protein